MITIPVHFRELASSGVLFVAALTPQGQAAQEMRIHNLSQEESGLLRFTVAGPVGQVIAIEQSRNLRDWVPVTQTFSASGELEFAESADWGRANRFYRVRAGAPASVTQDTYHGWTDAFILSNGIIEAVVVPTIGRIMQMRFIGQEGPFWENRSLDGTGPGPGWGSGGGYGGDKAWPSPQSIWNWPPPVDFDGAAHVGSAENGVVTLVSPVDDEFGIRTTRRIQLVSDSSSMIVTTAFERVEDTGTHGTKTVGIWVVTQMQHPQAMYAPVPADSIFNPLGFKTLSGTVLRPEAPVRDGILRFTRSLTAAKKIGLDGGSLLWMNEAWGLRLDSPRVPGAEYPDFNSSTEIYTNPDPAYIELEMMGPLDPLPLGATIERSITYTLIPRTVEDHWDEARKIYGLD